MSRKVYFTNCRHIGLFHLFFFSSEKVKVLHTSLVTQGYFVTVYLPHGTIVCMLLPHRSIFYSKVACKRTQQLPTMLLRQQCWKFLRAFWQWCANGCNNSQQFWDLQCIVGRIQPISLCKPCVTSVRGTNNVGRAVQTDPTLVRYASAITEQKK